MAYSNASTYLNNNLVPTSTASHIAHASALLKAGHLVAFPTETVYGLGADATNPSALQNIFIAKGRPADHPLIVHLASAARLTDWARDIPPVAWELAREFWPGPLTLILKCAAHVSPLITGGQDTIGLRVPKHAVAQALLRQFDGAIAAPSANRFGRISPTRAEHVRQELGDTVALILDGGACAYGIESTIVDVSCDTAPRILRPGSILRSQLQTVIDKVASVPRNAAAVASSVRVSGQLASHYAPYTPLRVVATQALFSTLEQAAAADPISVLAYSALPNTRAQISVFKLPATPAAYAQAFYASLRAADARGGALILVEALPDTEAWCGVQDRLRKAAAAFLPRNQD